MITTAQWEAALEFPWENAEQDLQQLMGDTDEFSMKADGLLSAERARLQKLHGKRPVYYEDLDALEILRDATKDLVQDLERIWKDCQELLRDKKRGDLMGSLEEAIAAMEAFINRYSGEPHSVEGKLIGMLGKIRWDAGQLSDSLEG